jgi:hypothetical protein
VGTANKEKNPASKAKVTHTTAHATTHCVRNSHTQTHTLPRIHREFVRMCARRVMEDD